MNSLRELIGEYDQLGDTSFSSAHDFTRRQRKLETWAAKAREAIAEVVRTGTMSGEDRRGDGDVPDDLKRTGY